MATKISDYTKRIPPRRHAPEGAPVDYTVREFCAALRIAPSTAYRLMKDGAVDWYAIGHSRRVKAESVDALRQSHRDTEAACPTRGDRP